MTEEESERTDVDWGWNKGDTAEREETTRMHLTEGEKDNLRQDHLLCTPSHVLFLPYLLYKLY